MLRRILVLLLWPAISISVEGPESLRPTWEARVLTLTRQVDRALGFRYEGPIHVLLARTDREFLLAAKGSPEWAAAVALPRDAVLVIRLPAIGPETGVDAAGIVRHELVHLLLPTRVGGHGRVPLWFEEGLAQVLGARILKVSTARLKLAAATGRLLPLAALADRFPESRSQAGLAYAQSESAVRLLVEEHGSEGLKELLDGIRGGATFEESLEAATGLGSGAFEAAWRRHLSSTGRPWWIEVVLENWLPFLLFAASLLVIVAFLRARRRRKATYESLPE